MANGIDVEYAFERLFNYLTYTIPVCQCLSLEGGDKRELEEIYDQYWLVSVNLKIYHDVLAGDMCDPDPCMHGGTCSPAGEDDFTCACPSSTFTGKACNIITGKFNR